MSRTLDWFPHTPIKRELRSAGAYTFTAQAPGPRIRAVQSYVFGDLLKFQNAVITQREDSDPVYRGEVLTV
jgi:hypothetical protein